MVRLKEIESIMETKKKYKKTKSKNCLLCDKKDIIDKTIANLDKRFLIKLLDYDYSSKVDGGAKGTSGASKIGNVNIINDTESNIDQSHQVHTERVNIDIITITNMLSKVYIREIYGAINNKLVADIMDILIDYNNLSHPNS
jgi:hypothetical protein